MQAASESGMVFAAGGDGAYVIPGFQPSFDAMAALCKLLDLLASVSAPVSELVAELPEVTIVDHTVPCSWALKGLVMRVLTERLAGRDVDLRDGIKVFDNGAWGMVRPDPVEPLVHVTVETPQTAPRATWSRSCCRLVGEALAAESGEPISS